MNIFEGPRDIVWDITYACRCDACIATRSLEGVRCCQLKRDELLQVADL